MEHAFYDNEKAEKQPKTYQRKKEDHEFDLLIDIQKKLAQGKGKYYVRFAKNYNTKQVAKANIPYSIWEKRKEENPGAPVEKIKVVCMGHEADLKASLEQDLSAYKLEIEVVDILRDKKDLQFKRDADAEIIREGNKLVIKAFYPMNLLQKLSLQKETVDDWKQLVESVFIDWNYDGKTMHPAVCDITSKDEVVSGVYDIPDGATNIKVKITDLLSESLEMEV